MSTALDKAYAFDCPPEGIHVISHRRLGSDELWAVEACGTKREVELGLEFPATPGEPLSEAEIEQIRENLRPEPGQPPLPELTFEVFQAARAKAGQWCLLGPASDPSKGISNQSLGEQRACQERLEATTAPLGADRDDQGIVRYWFRVGSWAFPSFVSYHAPACSRLTLSDTPEHCACAKAAGQPASCSPALVASSGQPETGTPGKARAFGDDDARSAANPTGVTLFGRAGFGLGYLGSSGDNVSTTGSVAIESDLWGGLQLHPRFALGVGLSRYDATADDSVTYSRYENLTFISGSAEVRPWLLTPAALVSALPFPFPLRVDAEVGIGLLTRASPRGDFGLSKSSGLYLAGGVGWEAPGDYVDVGFSGKVFSTNTEDGSDSFTTSGYGVLLNLWTHPRRRPKAETDDGD